MKHTVSQRQGRNGVELMQAVFTLLTLTGIYVFSTTYSGNTTSLRDVPAKPVVLSAQYWNDTIGYGFSSVAGDKYIKAHTASGVEQVEVRP
jgi:hypothetical protein